jgi:hypothetical protein
MVPVSPSGASADSISDQRCDSAVGSGKWPIGLGARYVYAETGVRVVPNERRLIPKPHPATPRPPWSAGSKGCPGGHCVGRREPRPRSWRSHGRPAPLGLRGRRDRRPRPARCRGSRPGRGRIRRINARVRYGQAGIDAFTSRPRHWFTELVSDESSYIDRYAEELRRGHHALRVPLSAPVNAQRTPARQILSSDGAHHIVSAGRWSFEIDADYQPMR